MNALVASLLLFSYFCHSFEDGWKGIKPLRTDKAGVEKIFGKGEVDDNGYYTYRTNEEFVQINYTTAPCTANMYGRGKYKVPEQTVLDYKVSIEKPVLLKDVGVNLDHYYRDASGDLKSAVHYQNAEDGVDIGVQVQGLTEYFAGAYFSPSKKDKVRFRC